MLHPVRLLGAIRRGEIRWLNYLLASGLALGSDAGLFLLLLDAGLRADERVGGRLLHGDSRPLDDFEPAGVRRRRRRARDG